MAERTCSECVILVRLLLNWTLKEEEFEAGLCVCVFVCLCACKCICE